MVENGTSEASQQFVKRFTFHLLIFELKSYPPPSLTFYGYKKFFYPQGFFFFDEVDPHVLREKHHQNFKRNSGLTKGIWLDRFDQWFVN